MTKINFNTHGITWTEAMETFAKEAIEKSMKRTALLEVPYTVKASIVDKKTKLIKVELSGGGFRAQCTNKDFYTAMTAVASKFKSLVLKQAKKLVSKKRKGLDIEVEADAIDTLEDLISKEKTFILDPMEVETAIQNFEQTDYTFYVFRDIDTNNEVAVLYKRFDGSLGIIRCR
jgi:ribosome-associated translation inhibitor RaiA